MYINVPRAASPRHHLVPWAGCLRYLFVLWDGSPQYVNVLRAASLRNLLVPRAACFRNLLAFGAGRGLSVYVDLQIWPFRDQIPTLS